ncbi:hypothetical protein E2C01_020432 [Portunus trituberculatus]|uniref:Uncharacterized protein n=1 Tax=Portunus trituberculatus TaxID=210409 RepID=A0A5B7E210_PORTR|nr:hypothetical protein [Portunus trituberculatus]
MEAQTAALVEEAPSINHSTPSVEDDSGSQGDVARLIHYPRSATIFAAIASILFIIVGILGVVLRTRHASRKGSCSDHEASKVVWGSRAAVCASRHSWTECFQGERTLVLEGAVWCPTSSKAPGYRVPPRTTLYYTVSPVVKRDTVNYAKDVTVRCVR